MKLARTLLAIAGIASIAAAAATDDDFDAEDVNAATRKQWCISQKAACPLICNQMPNATEKPDENTCDEEDLSFSCVCSNGQEPNATEYSQTIPYYICTEQNNQCVKNCPGNSGDCQYRCRADHPCGAKNPKRLNTTSTATATGTATLTAGSGASTGASLTSDAASSTTSTAVFTGMAGEEASDSGAAGLSPLYGYAALLSVVGGYAVVL